MSAYSDLITFTTAAWEYVDLEFRFYSHTAGQQTSAVFFPRWDFTKGSKTGASRTYTAYLFNTTRERAGARVWAMSSMESSSSGIHWDSSILRGRKTDGSSDESVNAFTQGTDQYVIVIISSATSENTVAFEFDNSENITTCVTYKTFQTKLYWTISANANILRPDGLNTPLRGIIGGPAIYGVSGNYDGTQTITYTRSNQTSIPTDGDIVSGSVVNPKNVPYSIAPITGGAYPDGYPYGHGIVWFKAGDKLHIDKSDSGTLQLGPYQSCTLQESMNQKFVGWAYSPDNSSYEGYGTDYDKPHNSEYKTFPANYEITLNSKPIHLEAVYETASSNVTISFDKNTSSSVSNMPAQKSGDVTNGLSIPTNIPTRSGYTFIGWATNSDDLTPLIKASQVSTYKYYRRRNITLYAVWGNNSSIRYYKNDGTSDLFGSVDTKTYGTAYTIKSAIPTRTNYQFIGWNTSADGSGTNYRAGNRYNKEEDLTLYAQWKLVTKYIWIKIDATTWKQGIPWVKTESGWIKGKNAFIKDGSWKEEK